jgi:hypothetical protein
MRKPPKVTTASSAPKAGSTVKLNPQPGQSNARSVADSVVTGTLLNSALTKRFSSFMPDEMLDLSECAKAIGEAVSAVQAGDLRIGESLLTAQAVSLNAIFGEFARRSAANMGEHLGAAETYMRLALKAQSQCRATVEALGALKSPPFVYARQMNVAHGPLQVNNGGQAPGAGSPARAPAPASKSATEPDKLLEASHGERLDFGAQTAPGRTHPDLEPVEVLHRPTN